jgi:AMIN domain
MKSFRILVRLVVLLSLGLGIVPVGLAQAEGQLAPGTHKTPATITSVRAVPGNYGAALEIISSHPLVPAISKLDDPPRLVIDLADARLSDSKKRIAFRSGQIAGVRIGQFQPSVARIVVDLAQPVSYAWDATGNRLMIRLHPADDTGNTISFPAFTSEAPASVVPLSAGSSRSVVLAGNRLAGGSSVTAGSDTAILRLDRGGEVRVCPGTTVSVTPSQSGRSLMLGMSTGALEAHYTLEASSDSILTPDFRILLAGPGEFHYAISADLRGNTCVQALPGNTASVIVSEVLGDGTYQVKPAQQVMFHSGQLKTADSTVPNSCGCPPQTPAILRASSSSTASNAKVPSLTESARSKENQQQPTAASSTPPRSTSPETAALPPSRPDDVHVQVDVPFVFRANDVEGQPPSAETAPTREVALLPIRDVARPGWLQIAALPPDKVKAPRRGFFGRVKGFLAAIFG